MAVAPFAPGPVEPLVGEGGADLFEDLLGLPFHLSQPSPERIPELGDPCLVRAEPRRIPGAPRALREDLGDDGGLLG